MNPMMGRTRALAVTMLLGIATVGVALRAGGNDPAPVPGIIPSGHGTSVDVDLARSRAATARFRDAARAVSEGYPAVTACVEHQPHGAMGLHYTNNSLSDVTLDVEQPEVLVYERMADGTIKLNGVEYIVPIAAWTRETPPVIMGQPLKRADQLGIWYLHVWNWEANPSGVFADWNPNVKCR